MFAQAGPTVTTLALHQAAWILRRLFPSFGEDCVFTLDWAEWPPNGSGPVLFCWEAFVSQAAHSTSTIRAHVQDAATAAKEFLDNENDLEAANAVTTEHPLSMIGAAALWSGWATDPAVLHEPALVVKPLMPYEGPIREPSPPAESGLQITVKTSGGPCDLEARVCDTARLFVSRAAEHRSQHSGDLQSVI